MAKKPRKSKRAAASAVKKRRSAARPRVKSGPSADGALLIDQPEADRDTHSDAFPIVGVGASAGGLEAFSQLLHPLPQHTGMAIILVQHLAPKNISLLPDLLALQTNLPVHQVTDGTRIEPDNVYVIPPDRSMTIRAGELRLTQREKDRTHHAPIDTFFSSLADYAQSRAIGVILSGTATDGASGIKAIKAAGGITMAQQPESARFDGMPRAAIATGMVDLVLQPADIAGELLRTARHPYLQSTGLRAEGGDLQVGDEQLLQIFQLLRGASGVDFAQYKLPTIRRRLHRRMALHKLGAVDHYLKYLQENPGEVQSLYEDILIHVTRFFREPDSFEALKEQVFPQIVSQRNADNPLRIWVPGCSTGEEPYSVAIALLEYLRDEQARAPIQIFATDLSETAIERARAGMYPESISADMSPERLRQYFIPIDGKYRINKNVRELCIFARQDLTRDPPFSKLDLIVCRNVLIYLGAALQRRLMTLFHAALKPHGFLMLGHAESAGIHADLFGVAEKKHRLYSKKTGETPAAPPGDYRSPLMAKARKLLPSARERLPVQNEVHRLLLDRYTPPGVVVDPAMHIVEFHGQTGPFLEPAPGDASLHLLKMAREGLVYGLRKALREARKSNAPVRRQGLQIDYNGHGVEVDLEVVGLGPPGDDRHYLILFHQRARRSASRAAPEERAAAKRQPGGRIQKNELSRLRQELTASREYLQSIIQDLEATNEELQSANEEILSSNEELQSTNEELDTAKEELQSTNEELNTLNDELHGRNEELSRVNSDLVNLLGSVQIAIVIVSGDLHIRRFTPMAEKVLNLIPTDVGRPIGHIKPNIDGPDLEQLVTKVIDSMAIEDCEVRDRGGRWYSLRIRPYKNIENRIDGAVLSLFDIDDSKKSREQFARLQAYAAAILDLAPDPVFILDHDMRLDRVNRAYLDAYKPGPSPAGTELGEFHAGVWNHPELRSIFERVLADKGRSDDYRYSADLPGLGRRAVAIDARAIVFDGQHDGLLVAVRPVGE